MTYSELFDAVKRALPEGAVFAVDACRFQHSLSQTLAFKIWVDAWDKQFEGETPALVFAAFQAGRPPAASEEEKQAAIDSVGDGL